MNKEKKYFFELDEDLMIDFKVLAAKSKTSMKSILVDLISGALKDETYTFQHEKIIKK